MRQPLLGSNSASLSHAAAVSGDCAVSPEYIHAELISGGNAPKSISYCLRVA
jgi:hypothetical protein